MTENKKDMPNHCQGSGEAPPCYREDPIAKQNQQKPITKQKEKGRIT